MARYVALRAPASACTPGQSFAVIGVNRDGVFRARIVASSSHLGAVQSTRHLRGVARQGLSGAREADRIKRSSKRHGRISPPSVMRIFPRYGSSRALVGQQPSGAVRTTNIARWEGLIACLKGQDICPTGQRVCLSAKWPNLSILSCSILAKQTPRFLRDAPRGRLRWRRRAIARWTSIFRDAQFVGDLLLSRLTTTRSKPINKIALSGSRLAP
jgi:hypothetical protein